jgi:alkylated DNA repair protein alkB family protein 7
LVADFLLPRYGLYVMTGVIRYEFTHEILKESESRIGDEPVPRDRRISIICREPPRPENIQKD